jgi:two-component system response regulator AtoC
MSSRVLHAHAVPRAYRANHGRNGGIASLATLVQARGRNAFTPMALIVPTPPDLSGAEGLPPLEVIFGASPALQQLRLKLERIGDTPVPVLITGESGTGKEVLARLLHRQSQSAGGPFVKLNCPAIPATLLESELFGFEKGAFTGAHASKPGRIEQAEGGTVFLDEIGELELGLQAKLLQLLQDGCFMRLGGQREVRARARMLFATNRRLEDEVAAARFRCDLYYRINVVGFELPPLRHRREDIPVLTEYFRREFSSRYRRTTPPLGRALLEAMQAYAWPGNVRELENLMKRYVLLGGEEDLWRQVAAPPRPPAEPAFELGTGGVALKSVTRQAVQELEREIILQALEANQWNRKRAAEALHISYRGLLYKLKEAGVTARAAGAGPRPPARGQEES